MSRRTKRASKRFAHQIKKSKVVDKRFAGRKQQSAIIPKKQKPAEQRAYEATSTGRRLGQWDAPALEPTQAVSTELDKLRNRNRAAQRNNPWSSRAVKADVATEIGTGIIPRAASDNEEFNKAIMELWRDYTPYADLSGILNAYGFQWSGSKGRKEGGEVFIRIIRQRSNRNMPVPLQFQILESDYCPTSLNYRELSNGNSIKAGVEINPNGKPVAYWMYKNHPDDFLKTSAMLLDNMIRIKVEDIIHHFIPNRPGQLRGEPQGVQSLVRSYVFDKYDDAELGRKESRAHFTGVIRRPDYGESDYKFDPISGEPISKDDSDVPMIDMEAGTFPNLLPGEEITLFDGDDAGRGYKDYQHYQLLGIAAGQDVPYQLVSGDYTEINDRLWRAIMNQYHREVDQVVDLFVIAQICRRMWNEFVDRAVLSGAIKMPSDYATNRFNYIRCNHRPQAHKHIHPTQDVDAKVKEYEAGFKSRQKIIDETSNGESVEQVDKQRALDKKSEEELGLRETQEEIDAKAKQNEEKGNEQSAKTTK